MEKEIKHYKLIREVGKGGMGVVYKALNPGTQEHVAVKILPQSLVDRSTVERFNREARTLMKLNHPNILRVHDFGMDKGQHFLIMEFLEGDSLKALIKHHHPVSIQRLMKLFYQVAEALEYIHDQGLIHRDIKPANIMVTPDDEAKVMDFGLVKMEDVTRLTMEGTSLGTAEYMSPEQVAGEEVDARTDVYSLGVTMYEALCGRTPFMAESIQALMLKHKGETPRNVSSFRSDIPKEVERIVMKAMDKDLARRYPKMSELKNDILRVIGEAPVSKVHPRPSSPSVLHETVTRKPMKRKAPAIPVLLIMITGLIGGGTYLMVKQPKHSIYRWQSQFKAFQRKLFSGMDKSAKDAYKRAKVRLSTGREYMAAGAYEAAILEFSRAIAIKSNEPEFYKELALAYEAKRDWPSALNAWNQVLSYDRTGALGDRAIQRIEQLKQQTP